MSHLVHDFASQTMPQTHHFRADRPIPDAVIKKVKQELSQRGAVAYNLWLPETHYLPRLLHLDEHIMGSVFGKYKGGRGALVATDQRVLFIDKKPMFMHVDELTFMIIGGVTFTKALFMSYVTLHTRLGDYKLRTFNLKSAANFVDYIETKCLQQAALPEGKYDSVT